MLIVVDEFGVCAFYRALYGDAYRLSRILYARFRILALHGEHAYVGVTFFSFNASGIVCLWSM